MIERDKQVADQQKKHSTEKERQKHPRKGAKTPQEQQAGMSTDPQTMKDEGYVDRIDEKTSKH